MKKILLPLFIYLSLGAQQENVSMEAALVKLIREYYSLQKSVEQHNQELQEIRDQLSNNLHSCKEETITLQNKLQELQTQLEDQKNDNSHDLYGIVSVSKTHFRKSNTVASDSLAIIREGEYLPILETNTTGYVWYKVRYREKEGWVYSRNIRLLKEETADAR